MTPIPLTDTSRPPPPYADFWVYDSTPAHGWERERCDFPSKLSGTMAEVLIRAGCTHWHPDQPNAPTERPDKPWSTSPEANAVMEQAYKLDDDQMAIRTERFARAAKKVREERAGLFKKLADHDSEPQTEGQQIARELRAECNNLTPEQRKHAYEYGMKLINQSSDNRQAESANRQTPRTDAEAFTPDDWEQQAVFADFARTLERELATAHAECHEQARLNGMGAEREAGLYGRIAELKRELATTKAALAAQADYQRELRADRDRLDWLNANFSDYLHREVFGWDIPITPHNIRAAIDAAMQKQEG